ncbi:MAG: response regulator transcription factor [Treponema sp.]|nr:response regulator transcription factor [Treponema sp.]
MNPDVNTELPSLMIVEDHPVMREGLVNYFTDTGRWRIVGKASCLNSAKKILPCIFTDNQSAAFKNENVLLLDIQLKDGWGLDLIPMIDADRRPVIAVYTAFDDYSHVSAALGMGVNAFVCKNRDERELEQALLKSLNGITYIDDCVQAKLNVSADTFRLLTKRESEILRFVKAGLSNNEIAIKLGISRRTVENILSCIYDKTGIRTRLDLQRL